MLRLRLALASLLPGLVASFATTTTIGATDDVLFAFTGGSYSGWQQWNWDKITHLGFWTPPDDAVRAKAKAHGVRLLEDSHLPDSKDWEDEGKRKSWVDGVVSRIHSHKLDGVFFDYEGQLNGGKEKAAYSALAQETAAALAPLNASIVICVGASPSYELRDFDYAALAEAADFLFIMGYDMHFWDDYTCILKGTCSPAEAPLKSLKDGVSDYKKIVSPRKLVLGLPWYGQRYDYVLGLPINYGQIDYKDVLSAFDEKRVTKKTLEKDDQSWKIDCKHYCMHDQKGDYVWYDDAQTLKPKYAIARDSGLRGVGMWSADKLPAPSDKGDDPHKAEREAMWSAISEW